MVIIWLWYGYDMVINGVYQSMNMVLIWLLYGYDMVMIWLQFGYKCSLSVHEYGIIWL